MRLVNKLDDRLLQLAQNMGIEIIDFHTGLQRFGESLWKFGACLGLYHSNTNTIILNELSLMLTPELSDMALAHELIHATGHMSMLGRNSITKRAEYSSRADTLDNHGAYVALLHSEEYVAQLAAKHLCEALGIGSDAINNFTAQFLSQYPAAHAKTVELWGNQAVTYIEQKLLTEKAA